MNNDLRYNAEECLRQGKSILSHIKDQTDLESAREALYIEVSQTQYEGHGADKKNLTDHEITIMRDCARVFRSIIAERADELAGFSVTKALWDISRQIERPDLSENFYAEIIHLFRGLNGNTKTHDPDVSKIGHLSGREAAIARSEELDRIWSEIESVMSKYSDGLEPSSIKRREERKNEILSAFGGTQENWKDWGWQIKNIITDHEKLASIVNIGEKQLDAVKKTIVSKLPFGITPYYASLMDNDPESGRDMAVRAQVLPPPDYVDQMAAHGDNRACAFDFMLETDTSPIDLITRRYPAIVILKPFNTCPQICVYCQRNWEIDQAMAPQAMADQETIEKACKWIEDHEAIREVLVTGGDPLAMPDEALESILKRLSRIKHVEMIRIGSRVPVTMPMRINEKLASMIGKYRKLGERDICVVTHIEHPYEVTPDLVEAVDRLRRQGIGVYNQFVYTFFVSRRFEAARLRLLIRKCGIDPYYTFAPKGKEETADYRLPIARILQEQKEEARLLPGSRRTDEPVYNVPGLGKNYLRAFQHRNLISVMPDGSRVYEFHPWEKNLIHRDAYVGTDVPVLKYLSRLAEIGEKKEDYSSIWYYF